MVLGGDFNVSIDKGQGGELEEVTKVFGLQDAFRAAGDGGPGYTWWNSRQEASRLDYLFFSKSVKVSGYAVQPMWCSDHGLVGSWVEGEFGQRGRGRWKLNTTYLLDPIFCRVMKELFVGWRNLKGFYQSHSDWWEGVKERVKFFVKNGAWHWRRKSVIRHNSGIKIYRGYVRRGY